MTKKWTEEDLEILKYSWAVSHTIRTIAIELGRSPKSVERKIHSLGLKPRDPQKPAPPKDPTPSDYWKTEFDKVKRTLEKERMKHRAVDALVEQAHALAPQSYDTAPPIKWPSKTKGKPQSAVLLLSDTHIGQVVTPEQTLGMGDYNFQVFLARLKRLEEAIYSILHDHTNTPIDELVIPMLGDMLHGSLIHSVEAGQHHTIFEQFYNAGHALAQFLRNLSATVPWVRIYTAVGNHPRFANQHKMPTDNRYSNFDSFLYAYLQALTKDVKNIGWNLDKQPFAIFDVQGWTFWCGHGDNLRGGDKALGIPAHSIGRRISSTMGMRSQAGKPLVNYYCTGHLHKAVSLPHTLGDFMINGGFPGVDGYGLAEGFQGYRPCQKFFFVHPELGQGAEYKLWLDLSPKAVAPYYKLPSTFNIK